MRAKKRSKSPLLGPLELEIMQIVWELDDVAVAEVVERLPGDRHHNTVMTVMKRLTDKGFLRQYARDGRSNGYRPKRSRDQVSSEYLVLVQEQLFGGSLKKTLSAFIGCTPKNARKARELRDHIERLKDE